MGGAAASAPDPHLNRPWHTFLPDTLNDMEEAIQKNPPPPIPVDVWHNFLIRMLPLTQLPHEVAGRASRIGDGSLHVHFLLHGVAGHVPPEIADIVYDGYAECYFHVHPAVHGSVACWPSPEDAIEAVRPFVRCPTVMRYLAIVTHCGLVVMERGASWDMVDANDRGWRYQLALYEDLHRAAAGITPERFAAVLARHGIAMTWIPLNDEMEAHKGTARMDLMFDRGVETGLAMLQRSEQRCQAGISLLSTEVM